MQLKVALFAGVILSSPWWIYQLWAFITPGSDRAERRYTLGFLAAGVPLFLAGRGWPGGCCPRPSAVLTGFTPDGRGNIIDAQTYLGFIMRMVLAFGVAFLLPGRHGGPDPRRAWSRARTWLPAGGGRCC